MTKADELTWRWLFGFFNPQASYVNRLDIGKDQDVHEWLNSNKGAWRKLNAIRARSLIARKAGSPIMPPSLEAVVDIWNALQEDLVDAKANFHIPPRPTPQIKRSEECAMV